MARCGAIKPNGERCKVEAIPDAEWCWSHHPDYEQQRQRRASKGGKRGGRGRPQQELLSINARLKELAEDVLAGRVDRGDAAVAGQLLNYVLRGISVSLKVREQEELVERMEDLEESIERQDRSRGYGA